MLYFAKFAGDLTPVLVGGSDDKIAAARVYELTGVTPVTLTEIPDEMCCCEVRLAGDAPEADDNPADATESGVALEPFDDFAVWLEEVDREPLPPALALAPTEPPVHGV